MISFNSKLAPAPVPIPAKPASKGEQRKVAEKRLAKLVADREAAEAAALAAADAERVRRAKAPLVHKMSDEGPLCPHSRWVGEHPLSAAVRPSPAGDPPDTTLYTPWLCEKYHPALCSPNTHCHWVTKASVGLLPNQDDERYADFSFCADPLHWPNLLWRYPSSSDRDAVHRHKSKLARKWCKACRVLDELGTGPL